MSAAPRALGTYEVTVEAAAAAALAAALGRRASDGPVPLTYPLIWLAAPAVRLALQAELADEGALALPVHIEQRIALSVPLVIGAAYRLVLTLDGPDARRILRLDGRLHDSAGQEVGSLRTGLVLVALPQGAGA